MKLYIKHSPNGFYFFDLVSEKIVTFGGKIKLFKNLDEVVSFYKTLKR